MNLRIYGSEYVDTKVFLKSVANCAGISVVVVDQRGDFVTELLTVQNDGKLYRTPGINSSLGLDLDAGGRLTIVNP